MVDTPAATQLSIYIYPMVTIDMEDLATSNGITLQFNFPTSAL